MKKSREITPEEHLQIVRDCLELNWQNKDLQMEKDLLKKSGSWKGGIAISRTQTCAYEAVKELPHRKGYPVKRLCALLKISRSAYYRWVRHPESGSEIENRRLAEEIQKIHEAHPFFHSDRGFQSTSAQLHTSLKEHRMRQHMSRAAHCIDNEPMEGFWGILKREMYYGHHVTSREGFIQGITCYIEYYNNQRLQRKLNVMSPMAYHELELLAA